jgi:hypothetical protein
VFSPPLRTVHTDMTVCRIRFLIGFGFLLPKSRKPKSIEIEFDFSYVATNQMGDRSAREPMKVVPSRDITTGRRKEPMNRGLPNGTSLPQGNSHYAKGYLPN